MQENEIKDLLERQRRYYAQGETIDLEYRKRQLKKLYVTIKKREDEIHEALRRDLGKSSLESYMCEVGLVLSEITYMLKHMKKYSKKQRVRTPLSQFAAKSYRQAVPYGNVLIISPWNYPFLLTMEPLVDAIAAGNTAIVKPSAYSPHSSAVMEKIIKECFKEEYVAIVKGGREENQALLRQKFDFVFFTGSQNVGKEVLRQSAEHLTPVVLELGGKSPCIVDKTADIKLAAKRIVFGKYLNCGQTCVAPDYILCDRNVQKELEKEIVAQIQLQYGKKPLENTDYGKIINEKHFKRLCHLIDADKVIFGGSSDEKQLKIEPTVMSQVEETDPVMQEEIFGPILPILTYDDFDTVIADLKKKAKPLACYLFSKEKKQIEQVTKELSYGGGCINDVIIHLATSEMGFGGVGESGMGSYHGKDGFDAFSHYKSMVDKKNWIDLPMRYQPYTNKVYEKLIRFFLK